MKNGVVRVDSNPIASGPSERHTIMKAIPPSDDFPLASLLRRACHQAAVWLLAAGWPILAAAQEARFSPVLALTNREMVLRFSAPSGVNYRIDALTNLPPSTNAPEWKGLLTLQSAGFNQHTDSAAPYLPGRLYRAEELPSTNILTGDHLATTNGAVVIHSLYYTSFVKSWNGRIIYSDPDDDAAYESRYVALPKADLILVTHEHGDHYSTAKLTA